MEQDSKIIVKAPGMDAGDVPMTTPSSPLPRRGYVYVILAAVLWAVSGSSGKFLFQQGITPFQVVQMRVTLSAVLLFVWVLVLNPSLLRIARRDILYFVILGAAGMAMVQFTYFYAISKIQVAVAILLEYLAPTFVVLYAVLFAREKLTRVVLTAVTCSTAGCYLAVGAYNFDLLAMNWVGIVAGIGAGISFAWYAIHGEHGMRRYHPWTVLFYALLFAALLWNILLPPLEFLRFSYTPIEWAWLLYIAVFGTVVPYVFYSQGISLIRSTRASITATLEPITAGFVAYFFLGESLEPLQMLGGALVIASVVLLQVKREYDDRTPALIRAQRQEGSEFP